jgi:transposase
MTTMTHETRRVFGGIDTHKDTHVAAVVDATGQAGGHQSFPTTVAGNKALLGWLRSKGNLVRVGVEGTGSWGASIARHLTAAGVDIVEVDRPNRQHRRRHGKSDPADAEAAARAALNGEATGTPKTRTGHVEAIRALRVARRSAMSARVHAIVQIKALINTAPDDIRERLSPVHGRELISTVVRLRPGDITTTNGATKLALKELAVRVEQLDAQLVPLNDAIVRLVKLTGPELLELRGVGPDTASILLVAAGDNPHRFHSEAAFAKLCGVAPLEASSGKVIRHRLNRTGDRQANHALWRIVLVRMHCDPRTRTYVQRRRTEGMSTKEIMRCLKRYVAREIYTVLTTTAIATAATQAA